MNVITRGIRNAFRNSVRTIAITVIIGLSLGLALAMLVAHQAVNRKIDSVKADVGNIITISPAGFRGFSGTGNPLTTSQLAFINKLPQVTAVEESLSDRLTSSDTNLKSGVALGRLGRRFLSNSGSFLNSSGLNLANFTPPIRVIGTTAPTDLANTAGGGNFKLLSGTVFPSSSDANVALIGSSIASKNNLKVGSTFTAYSSTITVEGIFSSGNTFSNNIIVFPLATEQRISSRPNELTSVIVYVGSASDVSSITNSITKQLGSAADVTNSAQQNQNYISSLNGIQTVSLYSLIGAAIAAAIIILLAMIMIVRERRREIGVLKALGATNLKVTTQFMAEAVTLTVLGGILGVIIGIFAGSPITNTLVANANSTSSSTAPGFGAHRRLGGFFGGGGIIQRRGGFFGRNISNIHAVVGWDVLIYGIVAAILIAVIASFVVSFLISKIRPAEVMRVE